MKTLILFIQFFLVASFVTPAESRVIESSAYGFREANPLKATIGATVLRAGPAHALDFDVEVKARRLPGWLREQRLHVRHYPGGTGEGSPKRLLHIIAGLGGDDMGAIPTYLAAIAQRAGTAVIVYPNTLTTNFAIAASSNGLVGAASEDAQDLYAAMKKTRDALAERGHHYSEHLLLGYFHGALLGAFV